MRKWYMADPDPGEDPKKTDARMILRVKNRDKRRAQGRAHRAVERAVKRGSLIRPDTCTICGGHERIVAHHEDYSKPLEIKWVCHRCNILIAVCGQQNHDGG